MDGFFQWLKKKMPGPGKPRGKPKTRWAKTGHDCQMPEEPDQLLIRYPGQSTKTRLKRCWMKMFIVSHEMTQTTSSHLKSHGSVVAEQKRQLNHESCIIHPYSTFRYHWDVTMVIVSYIQLVITPLDLMLYILPRTFPVINSVYFAAVRMTLDLVCLLDVGLMFITGYYDEYRKLVVYDYSSIAKRYVKGNFVLDLLASIPTHIDLFVSLPRDGRTLEMMHRLSILKVLRYVILERLYMKICNIKRINFYLRQGFFIGISMTLFWLMISAVHAFSEAGFENRTRIFMKDQEGLYKPLHLLPKILYNGALLINNVSAGVSEPQSNLTMVNRIFFWGLSRIVLTYFLARVIEFMNARTSGSRKYNRIVQLLSEFMRHKELPLTTQNKIIRYYEYHYQKNYYNEEEIMSTISVQLRQEIIMLNCRQLVESVQFFKTLPLVVLFSIMSFLHSETYMVNDVICRANTAGNCMYFISSGTVAVYTKAGKEICHLHDGDYFGEMALITADSIRTATVLAVEVCEVYRLERNDFIRAICPYPDLVDLIKRIAEERKEEIDITLRRQQ